MHSNQTIFSKEACEKKLNELMELVEQIEQQWEFKTNKETQSHHWSVNDIYKKEGA
ncbi:hypothetical protein [Gracilibacillus thailandensis]|uniref:Uncharacterized protein n=1 Tax=Gracilibacillus thailandensis TaxID=563735 RepID=A0A6N7R3Z7_9BACI|nr:hypothetical protein [Gracilibacillus thailandensis]MRI67943.1 hypothetical protein [Gracilibacillus thailandensis]